MAANSDISVSVLLRFMAEQARREIAGTSGDLKALGTAATDAGRQAASAGQSIDTTGTAMARSASEAANAAAQAGRSATSTAGLRDTVTGLATATTGAITPVNMMTSALGGQETAMQRAVASYAGITGGAESAFAAQLRHGMMLDGLKAKYNPLFAVSRQYETELLGIAEAERLGAIGATEAAAARDRAAASLRPMPGIIGQYGTATGIAAGHTANLFAQWNDIGIMMAAGQNPFQLALQQGTQVSQVLMMMGGGTKALKALGTSFLAMLNPISLATIGIIAFGAAGVQWLTSLGSEARSFDDELKDLNTTLDRMRTNLSLTADIRLDQKFGNMSAGVRELARGMLELDRATELKQLRSLLEKGPDELTEPGRLKRFFAGRGGRSTVANDQIDTHLRAQEYAKLGAANSYADFQKRTAEIDQLAVAGDIDGVVVKLAELGRAMANGGSVTSMKKELKDLFLELSKVAQKTAEVEALFNGTAHGAIVKHQTDQLVRNYTQQAQLAQATVIHGEHSAKIEEIRARHAREALRIKLEEMGADANGFDAMRARAALEIQLAADADLARQKRKKDQQETFDGLRREQELSEAILQFGAQASEVEAVRSRHAAEVLRYRLEEKGWTAALIDDVIELTKAERERQRAIKANDALRTSNEGLGRLRLEASLIGQTEQVRRRALALYDAELQIRRAGIDAGSAEAAQLRRNAGLTADWRAEIDRIAQAWDRVGEATERSIDSAIDRLTEGDLTGALGEIAQEVGDLFKDLALKNPLKNAVLGTDYATLADVGGVGGIWGRLTGKAVPGAPQAMQAASMAVTTPMVTLNAGGIAGLGALGFGATGTAGGGIRTDAGGFRAGTATGSVQDQVWRFFTGKGLAPHQVAGILGNASAESAFNPFAVGDAGTSFGLFQHHGTGDGSRGAGLLSAVGGAGGLGNIQAQLEYTWQELLTSENGVLKRLMASPDLYSATKAFAGFERPAGWSAANPTASAGWNQRLAAAEAAMARFSTTTVTATDGLSTFGGGLDSFGQAFSNGLQGLFNGAGGGAGGGSFWSMIGSAAASAIGLPGFASGGDTGGSDPRRVAGLVHEQEYVFDAAATKRIGVGNLEAIRRGVMRGYASGGYVRSSMSSVPSFATAQPEMDMRPIIQINNTSSTPVTGEVKETTGPRGQRQYELVMSDAVGQALTKPGGGARRALRNTFGVREQGVKR